MDSRGDYFLFGSVFIKKNNKTEFFLKKTETELKSVQTDRFRFRFGSVFLGQKPVWLSFSVLARFDSVFFPVFFGLGSVRFSFFGFRLIKPKPNQTGRFFQNFNRFNRFFFTVQFFRLFFFRFSRFFDFFAHP
jgi:hypothetical protein